MTHGSRFHWCCILGILALTTFVCALKAGGAEPQADLLLLHGHIYTANPRAPWVEAVAIGGGKILAVGTDKELDHFRASAKIIDLAGHMAMPGIIDSHIHFLEGSMALQQFALDDLYTVAGIQRRIRDRCGAPARAMAARTRLALRCL